MAAKPIDEVIAEWYDKFTNAPEGLHVLCTRSVDDEPVAQAGQNGAAAENAQAEQKKEADLKERVRAAYWCSCTLAMDKRKYGEQMKAFTSRVEERLHDCEKCIYNWHFFRREWLQEFGETYNADAVHEMERVLKEFDFLRLDNDIKWARQIIEEVEKANGAFKKSLLGPHIGTFFLAVYAGLCYREYLKDAHKFNNFTFVFGRANSGKKGLALGAATPLPGATYFLFLDEDQAGRKRFAQTLWDSLPDGSMTPQQFDFAVSDNLADVFNVVKDLDTSDPDSFDKITRFWAAFLTILRTCSTEIVSHQLPAMDLSPKLHTLLLSHMECKAESVMLTCLEVFSALAKKSPAAFWAGFEQPKPFQVVEPIFQAFSFPLLLSQSADLAMPTVDGKDGPPSVSWLVSWINAVPNHEKTEACQSLLHTLFNNFMKDPSVSPDGHVACARAGLGVLASLLESFVQLANPEGSVFPKTYQAAFASPNNLLHLNNALNLTVQFKDAIITWAEMPGQPFEAQKKAMDVVRLALMLDSRAFAEECKAIHLKKGSQNVVLRRSADLWEGFLELLDIGNVELAGYMLDGMFPLLSVEEFRPKRKEAKGLAPSMSGFNDRYKQMTGVIGTALQRLGQFEKNDLEVLSLSHAKVLIGFAVHAEDVIRQSAVELIKTVMGVSTRTEAIVKLLQRRPEDVRSFTFAVTQAVKPPLESTATTSPEALQELPWGPQSHILNVGQDVIAAFCDTVAGLLRKATLSQNQTEAVYSWWASQWYWIEKAFGNTEKWSFHIAIPTMTEFCRQTIEFAQSLIEEDGLLASALRDEVIKANDKQPEEALLTEMMRRVLKPCAKSLYGLVKMLRLRDEYLVGITVKIVVKLFKRLHEAGLEINEQSRKWIYSACRPRENGRFDIGTNLSRQQKTELLVALDGDDGGDEIQFLSEKRAEDKVKPKRQTTLDALAKAGGAAAMSQRTNRDDVMDLTSSLESRRSTLDQMAQRQKSKVKAKLLPPKPPVSKGIDQAKVSALKESRQKAKLDKQKRDAEAIAKARAIRSGGLGAGTLDKERSEIMVDSSEEEDEEDSGDESVSAFLAQKRADRMAVDDAQRRQERALMQIKGPIKKRKQVLNEKALRARVDPNMAPLHQAVLEWDIFHDSNDPPNGVVCTQVANTYQSDHAYRNTFHPLLLFEAWRSFVTAMSETTSKPFSIRVSSRMTVDGFLNVTSSIPMGDTRERPVSEGDIVVLSKSENPLENQEAPHCLARIHKTSFKDGGFLVEYRISSKIRTMMPEKGMLLHVIKITNMTTIEREYATLQSLQYYDLLDEVLAAKPSPILKYGDEAVRSCMGIYSLNPGQAKAVLGAKDNDGFTLIQGPPGTGKTKTIVAMVGCLLTGTIGSTAKGPTTGAQGRPAGSGSSMKKLLVCAPSNAAVDELVLRLKQGVKTMAGNFSKINVLRLGRTDAINAGVKDVTLDELVNKRLEAENVRDQAKTGREKLHADAGDIKQKIMELQAEQHICREADDRAGANKLQREIDGWRKQQLSIGAKIDALKGSGHSIARDVEMKRKQFQKEILSTAHVLCATLSGSGHDLFKSLTDVDFDTVIIDEAAQCVELSALIPLKYGALKCILVGDPKQLPPTVLSQSAARYGYDQSLFVRMQRSHPNDVHLLDRQYRMHPLISVFPSREFYEGRLVDGDDMAALRKQPWHNSTLFSPYRFFDVKGVQAKGTKGRSLVNVEELSVAMQLYERLHADYRGYDFRGKIGIITPYKAQLFELRTRFTNRYGNGVTEEIEFNTTDAFQGRECEIIIFSCVRASPTGGIGFMTDIRRMNVGLTRAKSSLWILGDSRALVQGEFWSKLIDDAKDRNLYTSGDVMSLLRRPTEKITMDWEPAPRTLPPASTPRMENAYTQEVTMQHSSGGSQFDTPPPRESQGLSRPGQFARPGQPGPIASGGMNRRVDGIGSSGQSLGGSWSDKYVERPVIQSSVRTGPSPPAHEGQKKRPHDGQDDSGPNAKRIASNHGPTGQGPGQTRKSIGGPKALQGPRGPPPPKKAHPTPPPPTKAATDPAAIETLGLAPPRRPPPPATAAPPSTTTNSTPSSDSSGRPPPRQNMPPAPRPKAQQPNPFIKRRPGRR